MFFFSLILFVKVFLPSASNFYCRKNQRDKIVLLKAKKQKMLFRKHLREYGFLLSYDFAR